MDMVVTDTEIEAFQKFSRVFRGKMGVVDEHLLANDMSMTEARVLYVLGQQTVLSGQQIAALLGLDQGYVSRMLKGFVARGLIHKRASEDDRRSFDVLLTVKGRKLYQHMQVSATEAVATLLAGLSGHRRNQMLRAMQLIEQTLTVPHSMAGVQLRAPQAGDISWAVHRQAVLYHQDYGWGAPFEALLLHAADAFITGFKSDRERAWIADYGGEMVGAIVVTQQAFGVAELRMFYVEPHVRGLGIGRKLLDKSIAFAREKGYRSLRLWTNDVLHRARGMFEREGFVMIEASPNRDFGENLTAQVWELVL